MSPYQKLLKGRGAATESRLVLEDRELYVRIRKASPQQRLAVSVAVARWAVTTAHLAEPAFDRALANLALGKAVSSASASAVNKRASYLDGKYLCLQQQRDEGGEVSEDDLLAAFSLARAANCVDLALSGEADEATYEAIAATDNLPAVHAVVTSALFAG
jgi:hypothetical protein